MTSRRETSSEIDEAAALWALRVDDAELGNDERGAFDLWLASDSRRVGAFVRAQAVLIHAKRAKALGVGFEPSSFKRETAEDEVAISRIVDMPVAEARSGSTGLTRRKMLIGASAIAASGAIALIIPTQRAEARYYETKRGETRVLPLDDNSTVTLNTDSRIAVTKNGVQLVRGEALFEVVNTGGARFMVEADDTSLRAQNAKFAVCLLDSRPFQVKVCEGAVEVERGSFLSRRRYHIGANVQATLSSDGAMIEQSVSPQALERQLAWRDGMLAFEDTSLGAAAEEFARYSDRRIRIIDPTVKAETVTGLFAANNPEGFARAVALGLNLHMQSTPGGIILLR